MKGLICLLLFVFLTSFVSASNNNFLTPSSEQALHLLSQIEPDLYARASQRIEILARQYESFLQKDDLKASAIPGIIHFIALDETAVDLTIIRSWQKQNPSFSIYIWTDNPMKWRLEGIIEKDIRQLHMGQLQRAQKEALNSHERGQLLSYEILAEYGGIYVDSSMMCIKSVESLAKKSRFFVGLEEIAPTAFSQYVHVGNSIIGAIPCHPILLATRKRVQKTWQDTTDKVFRLADKWPLNETFRSRLISARTFLPLTMALFDEGLKEDDLVLPARCFQYSKGEPAEYALNCSSDFWKEKEFKKKSYFSIKPHTKERLTKRMIKSYNYAICFCTTACLLCAGILFTFYKRVKN